LTGLGEASLNGWEPAQMAVAESLRTALQGRTIDEAIPLLRVYPHSPGGLIASSVASATEQAITDLRAKFAGVPVHALLGGKAMRKAVRVYANINRGARNRSPDGIAQAARNAVAAGYAAVKIAPFDGVYPDHPDAVELKRLTQLGVDRVYAIREAVGPDIDIMVDCHWRFDEPGALKLIRDLRAARLYWLECPTSENPDGFASIRRIHDETSQCGMKLAGAERQVAVSGFRPFVTDRLLDVVMPDIKYAGGYAEMLNIAETCAANSVGFSPHNPSGPICNMASIHLCAIAPAFLILEFQLAESPLYIDVVKGFQPKLVNSCFEVPDTPGIGVELDDSILRGHPYKVLASNANLDPRLG
jgi:galactonate dehydratase